MTTKASRFEVDEAGWRELQGSRPLWQLIKELPVNVFDEFARDDVDVHPTFCSILLERVSGQKRVRVTVEDDGAGFQRLSDSFTIFRTTAKRAQAQVAGRFNLGEKELMAVAYEGWVETTSGRVHFSEKGKVIQEKMRREKGTLITAVLPLRRSKDFDEAVRMLERLIPPPGLIYTVNGKAVTGKHPDFSTKATLTTFIQATVGEPMRRTARKKTDVEIYREKGKGWLYELGCPIQEVNAPFSIDVRQKVPMPPERDTVADWYLQDVFSAVLSAVAPVLTDEEAGASWVALALGWR